MPVNKIITKVDGVINKTIDFNDLKAGLAVGSHTITVEAFNGATLISTQTRNITIASSDTTAPTITTATVEDANPDKLVVVFSEVVTITNTTGLTITGAATPTLSAPTGSGSNTITFTLSTALTNGQAVTLNVASSNTIKDAANNALVAATVTIANNVAAVVTYDAKTTDFMNAVGTPNDSAASIYPNKTNADIWNLFDSVVAYYKAQGVWNDIIYWHPRFGDTADKNSFNAKDVSVFKDEFFGGWVFDSTGCQGNGTNTYSKCGFIPNTHFASTTDVAMTIVSTVGGTEIGMEFGSRNSVDNRFYMALNFNGSLFHLIGTYGGSVINSLSTGIFTTKKVGNTVTTIRNKNATPLFSSTDTSSLISSIETNYGAVDIAGEIQYYSDKTLADAMMHKGSTDTIIIQEGLRMWNEGLGRITI